MDSPKPKTLTFQDTPTDKTDDEPPPEREHFHIQKYVPEEKPPVPMLDPDNPLLEKFQKALKQHLLEQIEILSGEVFELETAAKKKDEARESIGVEAYEAQQLVVQQQAELDVCVTKLKDITAAREEVEAQLDDLTKVHRETTNKLLEAEREEMDLQNEIESTNLLTHQMKQWEDYVESELMVNQRMSEKTRKDKIKLAEEKRAQDMHVYRLMTEIWKLESELETLDMQLRVKEDEREKFAEAVAQCNTDIEAFETEYRCLLHSWNSVVVAVGIRDKHYNQMKTELDTLHEKVVNMGTIIQQVKKECNKELERNEVLTSVKHRIDGEIKSYTVQLEERNQNRGLLEREMYDMQLVVDRLNKDIEEIAGENNHKRSTFTAIMREFETLNSQKYKMEEENLVNLQNQLADAKAARHLSAQLKAHKETIKNLEITLANSENANSKTNMEMESQKRLNHDLEELLNELVKDRDSLQEQVDRYTKELKRCQIIVDKKQTSLDGIAKKIEKLMERSSGVVISPQELKIKALEKGIEEIQDKNKELQKFWLREQGHIVSLSEQRQEQIHQINLMRKQIMILEQKNLKISDEIDALEQEEERMSKNINRLHNEILSLNELLFKKRGSKTEMDKLHDIVQHAYTNKLKDCEIECLELEAMISELEEDKQNLSNKLIDLNREALAWEKKLKMAVEMKQNINEERKATGEIGNMKAEIHRMNVRYTQLRKAQEKLIHDLEHCISRRDAIFRTSLAREKKSTSDADHSRILYTRKLNDMRNKVKQIENEVAVLNEQLENARKTRDEIKASIANAQEDIAGYEEQKKCLLQELDNLMTQRQMKVEIIELKQRQAMLYSELLKGHKPYIMYRSESALFSTFDKHNQLNLKLIETVQGLLIEFPRYENILRRMFNTLTAYSVVMEE